MIANWIKREFSFLAFFWVITALAVGSPATAVAEVTIDDRISFQVIHGFGASQRVFDDPHVFENFNRATGRAETVLTTAQQDEIFKLLYSELGLTRVRPIIDAGIEVVNDNANPNDTDLSKFNFEWKRNDAHIEYVKRAMARGVTTYFLSPIVLEKWMTEVNPEEYVEWAMAILRRWRAFGLEMLYYSVVNEPGYQRSGLWSGQYILNVIKLMGPRLRAEGFKTKFVITDDLNATEAYKRCRIILADAEARQYVGALAFHLYDEPISQVSQMKELADRYGLPLWMTEYSQNDPFDWAVTMHQLISDYNVSAVDYMWGFFGQWTGGDKLINLRHTGARYLGYTLTKHYYVMGQFSKYVRPGFRRIKADSTDSTVKVTAYTDGSNVVVVSINQSNAEEIVKFQFVDSGAPVKLAASRTSKEGDSAALPDHLVRESTFTATLPGRSITTFYGVSGK